jgi:hypothetical protein
MKAKRLLILFLVSVNCLLCLGQATKLIENNILPDSERQALAILQKSPSNVSVDFVKINLPIIKDVKQFALEFGERKLSVITERIDIRGDNNFSYIGRNKEDGSSIILSVLDKDVQGIIETGNGVYKIETINGNTYAIVKLDHSQLKEGCEEDDEKHHSHSLGTDKPKDETASAFRSSASMAVLPSSCKIRVLVLYTPAAQSAVSNIVNAVNLAITETNQSLINSSINYRVELAYLGVTNYTESNYPTDLNRYATSGDGYMDEVFTLRNIYSADVCVLVIHSNQTCGLAKDVGPVSYNDAFCLVEAYNCMTGNYSFGHEIGHLLGCRHDLFADSEMIPFAYGHGYVSPNGFWRTVMAYREACGNCPRIQYWSNPNINYGGIPMGTGNISNNARVWNEQAVGIMALKQPPVNLILSDLNMTTCSFGEAIATHNINTVGTFIISNGKYRMKAGNTIALDGGFCVVQGAEFSAVIDNVPVCNNN